MLLRFVKLGTHDSVSFLSRSMYNDRLYHPLAKCKNKLINYKIGRNLQIYNLQIYIYI